MVQRPDLSVVLVSMPWATTTRPSLSLGLLAARARARGFACHVLYPNVFLSALVGAGGYEFLSNTPTYFGLAEHVFATDIFGTDELRSAEYLDSWIRWRPFGRGSRLAATCGCLDENRQYSWVSALSMMRGTHESTTASRHTTCVHRGWTRGSGDPRPVTAGRWSVHGQYGQERIG